MNQLYIKNEEVKELQEAGAHYGHVVDVTVYPYYCEDDEVYLYEEGRHDYGYEAADGADCE